MDPGEGYNHNVNNNVVDFQKPTVPTKPDHLRPAKTPQNITGLGAGRVTPRGWQGHDKFAFSQKDEQHISDRVSDSKQRFKGGWGPAPKVVPKEKTEKRTGENRDNRFVGNKFEKNRKESPVMQRYRSHTEYGESETSARINAALNPQLRSIGMESEEQAPGFGSLKRMWSQKTQPSDNDCDDSVANKRLSTSSSSSVNSQLSRSASNLSSSAVRPASFKKKTTTWHYVTAASPTEVAPQGEAVNSSPRAGSTHRHHNKPIDISLQTPRPFRSFSIDDDHSIYPVSVSKNLKSSELRDLNEHPQNGQSEHSKRLQSFDTPNEEQPPPLLPREKLNRSSRMVPPPSSYKMKDRNSSRSSMSSVFHRSRTDSRDRSTESYAYEDANPASTVPPPLLPRGEHVTSMAPLDYTPMSGTDMKPLTRDNKSMGSLASLDSVEEFSYEQMQPAHKDQNTFSYSTAIDPAQPKLSLREYHEIDPDPEVPVGVLSPPVVDPGSVPPPPDCEPPTLPPGAKGQRLHVNQPPASPPPLPPMNTSDRKGTKKLNYVEVEIGTGDTSNNKQKRKSQNVKTNYTEVIVGGLANVDGDAKKGKSVKGKIMSMFSSSKPHDGYASEGDTISESAKNADEQTTDFAKERNKLKRLSGRLLRKKKNKSRDGTSRQSTDLDFSRNNSVNADSKNAPVGIYGSATNLSTTSSESSRSSAQVTSTSHSGSSGDGQAGARIEDRVAKAYEDIDGANTQHTTNSKHSDAGRRQSYEPHFTQSPPKLDQKSKSVVELNSEITMSKSYLHPQSTPNPHSKSAESTPSHGYQARRTTKGLTGSPIISASRVQSHLHQKTDNTRVLPPVPPHGEHQPRPLSEPHIGHSPQERGKLQRPDSSPFDRASPRTSSRQSLTANQSEYPSLPKVLPLPLAKRTSGPFNDEHSEPLSPNFPTGSPPPPPSIDTIPERLPDVSDPTGDGPPTPMRDLKPDRFRKRRDLSSGSSDTAYSAAQDIPPVTVSDEDERLRLENGGDPIYDFVPDEPVKPIQRLRPSSKSKLLESEPLYQVYRSRTLSHASMRVRSHNPAQRRRFKSAAVPASTSQFSNWQSDLMTDDAGATTLWREVPEVVASGVGKDLSNDEMKLQQAQFEVVTSQASYMRSLNILIDHFMRDWAMESTDIVPKTKRKQLFSNVEAVREVEQRFLQEIEQHFWDKLLLTDIAKVTAKFARSDFEVYVRYIQNQVYQDRILTDLQRNNDKFSIELNRLESSPFCNKLPLLSFLLLPMQRVTRLPLLISAIVNQADSANDKEAYNSAKQALAVVNKLVKKCNEGARKMQQTEQLAEIASELTFAPKVKTYALVSQSRSLVKKGEMSVTIIQDNKKPKVSKLYIFLFTDVLLLARKKSFLEAGSNIKYEVVDWAKRAMLYVNEGAISETEIFLVLLENCFGKRLEVTLTPVSQNELSRWTDALNPRRAEESGDSIYESWDCPQYQCIIPYNAQQPDELTLDVGDVLRVVRKTSDGWLEGERLRDNEIGWFPTENCEEIEDEHVRARNLRNLYRIIPAGGVQQE